MGTSNTTIVGLPVQPLGLQQVTIRQHAIDTLTFDAVLVEQHASEMEVTQNPVETGVNISDHCYLKPKRVTITAEVSDLPMPNAVALYSDSSTSRSRRAYDLLLKMQADTVSGNLQPFDVFTGLRAYNNMVCIAIQTQQDVDSAHVLNFTAELVEVLTVTTATATYDKAPPKPRAPKTKRQADPFLHKGAQNPYNPIPVQVGRDTSFGTGIINDRLKQIVGPTPEPVSPFDPIFHP